MNSNTHRSIKYARLLGIPVTLVAGLAILFVACLLMHAISAELQLLNSAVAIFQASKKTGIVAFAPIPLITALISAVLFLRMNIDIRLHHVIRVAMLMAATAYCLYLVFTTTVALFGDRKAYFENAVAIADGTLFPELTNVYHRRALVYMAPVISLFHNKLLALQLANTVCLLLTAFFVMRLADQRSGKFVGTLALSIFLAIPANYLCVCTASHNVPGNLFVIMFIYVVDRMLSHADVTKGRMAVVGSILAGILMLAGDGQRSLGLPMLACAILVPTLCWLRRPDASFLRTIGPSAVACGFFLVINSTLMHLFPGSESRDMSPQAIIYSYNDFGTDGTWVTGLNNRHGFLHTAPENVTLWSVVHRYCAAAAVDPAGWVRICVAKSQTFFNFDWFLFPDVNFATKSRNSQLMGHPVFLNAHVRCFAYALAAIGWLRCMVRRDWSAMSLFPLVLFYLLLLSEVNPDYSLIIIPSIAVLAAHGIATLRGYFSAPSVHRRAVLHSLALSSALSLIVCFVLLAGAVAAFATVARSSNVHFVDMTGIPSVVGENSDGVVTSKDPFTRAIRLASGSASMFEFDNLRPFRRVCFRLQCPMPIENYEVAIDGISQFPAGSCSPQINGSSSHFYRFVFCLPEESTKFQLSCLGRNSHGKPELVVIRDLTVD